MSILDKFRTDRTEVTTAVEQGLQHFEATAKQFVEGEAVNMAAVYHKLQSELAAVKQKFQAEVEKHTKIIDAAQKLKSEAEAEVTKATTALAKIEALFA